MSARLRPGARRWMAASLGVLVAAVALVACTLTQSLDYLTKGDGLSEAGMIQETGAVGETSAPIDGGSTITTFVMNQTKPSLLAHDDTSLYWVSGSSVMSIPKTGGTPKVLGMAPAAAWLAVDASPTGFVYAAVDINVLRFAKNGSGGGPIFKPEAGAAPAAAVGANASNLFVFQSDPNAVLPSDVLRMLLDGGNVQSVIGATVPDSMTIGTKSVFWFDSSGTPSVAYELPNTTPAGGPPTQSKLGTDDVAPTYPNDAVTDDAALYWSDDTQGVLSLQRTPNAPVITLYRATMDDVFGRIAVDATNVYIIQTNTSGVLRVPKTGAAATLIAKNLGAPTGIVVDATHVWVTVEGTGATGGKVLMLTK